MSRLFRSTKCAVLNAVWPKYAAQIVDRKAVYASLITAISTVQFEPYNLVMSCNLCSLCTSSRLRTRILQKQQLKVAFRELGDCVQCIATSISGFRGDLFYLLYIPDISKQSVWCAMPALLYPCACGTRYIHSFHRTALRPLSVALRCSTLIKTVFALSFNMLSLFQL